MAGRAVLDRGERQAADGEVMPDSAVPGNAGSSAPSGAKPALVPWRGAGGRWLIWVFRALVWAILLLIGYRGVTAIFDGQPASTTAAAGTQAAAGKPAFPVALAEAFAVEFGRVYLNFSPATADFRAAQLSTFLPASADSSAGWNGAGTEHALDVQVAGIAVRGPHTAVVTLLARVNGRLIRLGVPVYAARGAMAVSADPALEPGPAKAAPPQGSAGQDLVTAGVLKVQLRAFFQAYASGDAVTMSRFLAPHATVHGLGGAVSFSSIVDVSVPTGGDTRNIIVTVAWQLPSQQAGGAVTTAPATLDMTYRLTVTRQSNSWYVDSIGPSTQSPGPP